MLNIQLVTADGQRLILGHPGIPAPPGAAAALGSYDPGDELGDAAQLLYLTKDNALEVRDWFNQHFPD